MLKSVIRWNATHRKIITRVTDIYATVIGITHNAMVMERYRIIARVWKWFGAPGKLYD